MRAIHATGEMCPLDRWGTGLKRLATMPARGRFLEQVLVDARSFWRDGWAELAASHGWGALDLFGVHPREPERRGDAKGLVCALAGKPVVRMEAGVVWIAARDADPKTARALVADADPLSPFGEDCATRFFRGGRFGGLPPMETIPVWELVQ